METLHKESRLQVSVKMDAVAVTGVWPYFPSTTTSAGRGRYAAGLYRQLILEELAKRKREKDKKPTETAKQLRQRIMAMVEKRIVQEDEDDFLLLLNV